MMYQLVPVDQHMQGIWQEGWCAMSSSSLMYMYRDVAMSKSFENARKLCRLMVQQFRPSHPEAMHKRGWNVQHNLAI